MSLPANDLFSFGLAHDSTHRPVLRRPSPSTLSSFTNPKATSSPSADGAKGKGKGRSKRKGRRRSTEVVESLSGKDVVVMNGNGVVFGEGKSVRVIDWEIPRKTLHSSIGFFTVYLWTSHESARTIVLILSSALAVIVSGDILRLNNEPFERLYERCLGFLMRESEKKTTNGVVWYMLGVIIVLTIFPLDIAVVAILILSWADTAASTVGRLFGVYTPPLPRRVPFLNLPLAPRKTLAGFIAATVTGACIAVGFWKWIGPLRNGDDLSWTWDAGVRTEIGGGGGEGSALGTAMGGWLGLGVIGLVTGVVAGIAEALDLGSLDDNLTLPIISGGCLYGFFRILRMLTS